MRFSGPDFFSAQRSSERGERGEMPHQLPQDPGAALLVPPLRRCCMLFYPRRRQESQELYSSPWGKSPWGKLT